MALFLQCFQTATVTDSSFSQLGNTAVTLRPLIVGTRAYSIERCNFTGPGLFGLSVGPGSGAWDDSFGGVSDCFFSGLSSAGVSYGTLNRVSPPVVRCAFVGMSGAGIAQAQGNVSGCLFANSAYGIRNAGRNGLGIHANRFQSNLFGIDSLADIFGGHLVSGNDFCGQTMYAIRQASAGAPVEAAANYWGTASEAQAGYEAADSRWTAGSGTILQLPILSAPATSANSYPGNGNALAAVACTSALGPCGSQPCMNGGSCADGVSNFTCTCPPAFSGRLCETAMPAGGCSTAPCQNGGVCWNGTAPGAFACSCASGYDGATCQSDANGCAPGVNPCYAGVACSDRPAPASGAVCGACVLPLVGDGRLCALPAAPPQVQRIEFGPDLATLVVRFDQPTDMNGRAALAGPSAAGCGDVLVAGSAAALAAPALLGLGYACQWLTSSAFQVVLGQNPTIDLSTTLSLAFAPACATPLATAPR